MEQEEMAPCPAGTIQNSVDIVVGKEPPEKADDRGVMFLESVESQVVSPGKTLVQIAHHNSSVEAASSIEQKVVRVLPGSGSGGFCGSIITQVATYRKLALRAMPKSAAFSSEPTAVTASMDLGSVRAIKPPEVSILLRKEYCRKRV
jgi:hypothetical protein